MDTVREFTHEEQLFYSRHLMLPGFGFEAQSRLVEATIAVVGLGGLGCPAAAQLAASGVGRLILIDPDTIDKSNVLRQNLYSLSDAGLPKVDVAAERLAAINASVVVESIARPFEPAYLDGCSAVLDCTDNVQAREAIARAARAVGILLVYGAAIGFEGRLAVFDGATSPCLGCLLPVDEIGDTCGEVGVFSPVTTVVGSMMAAEAIKHIGRMGTPPSGLTVLDGLSGEFHRFEISPNPACRMCGRAKMEQASVPTISVIELAEKLKNGHEFVLLDVREAHELDISRLDPCLHIPMNEVLWKSESLPRDAEIYVLCRAGNRSGTITQALRLRGFTNIHNVAGGINAYAVQVDPSLATY